MDEINRIEGRVLRRQQEVRDAEKHLEWSQARLREAEKAARDARPACDGFAWIGQSFKHCDECGKPFWEHTHDKRGVEKFGEVRLVPITPAMAAACKEKWDDPATPLKGNP